MSKKLRTLFLILGLVLGLLIQGCTTSGKPDDNIPGNTDHGTVNELHPEDEINEWIKHSQGLFLGQSREWEGTQYILVTYGMKESGGYEVEITDVEQTGDKILVTVHFKKPAPGQAVSEGITYPYELKEIPATGLSVEFLAAGEEIYVPVLAGLDYLRPIVVESSGIKVFAPSPGDVVARTFTVEGIGNVYEGNIQYQLSDDKGRVIIRGFTTAAMGNWKHFEIPMVLDASLPAGKELVVELFTQSPKDGSVQDQVVFNLTLQQ